MKTRMSFGFATLKTLAGAILFSAGLAAAQPFNYSYQYNQAPGWGDMFFYHNFDIDFSKSSSAFPSRNFPTWTAPNGHSVEYFSFYPKGSPGCFEITSELTSGVDPILYIQNASGTWVTFADDNAGNAQFRARVYMYSHEDRNLRISPYYNSDTNIQVFLTVKSIKANPGSTINSQSCRQSGMPYQEQNLNGGNPM